MRRFPRLLVLFSLLLMAFIWPRSSEVGVAMSDWAATPERLAPSAPAILSFTITPSVIRKGEEITLRWRVSNADHIWLSIADHFRGSDCIEDLSGERRVSPERDVIYKLHVWGQGVHELKEATVQVNGSVGFCTISGEVSNDRGSYGTRVNLYRLNSTTPLSSTTLDSRSQYTFTGVHSGIYRVAPSGRYRPGVGPNPRSQQLDCWPNDALRANFRIGGSEG